MSDALLGISSTDVGLGVAENGTSFGLGEFRVEADRAGRALMWPNRPERTDAETDALVERIQTAAAEALEIEAARVV